MAKDASFVGEAAAQNMLESRYELSSYLRHHTSRFTVRLCPGIGKALNCVH